jgi:putative nucleotidyltransferase with HDIG domain
VLISEQQALDLLAKYRIPEDRIAHSRGVAQFAFELASAIHSHHPDLLVNPQKVKIAGLLHDIGRSRSGDHEIKSIEILREEGLDDIADIIIHGTIYEIMKLRGKDRPDLLPKTLENKIVAYADTRFRLEPINLKDRMDEILVRRKNEPEKTISLKMAMPRYYALEQELMELTK